MIDITPIANAIIALIAAVISAFVIPYIKSKTDAERLEKINMWVTIAVEAAEQLYTGSGRGAAKKAYVVDFLNSKGYTLDPDSLDKLIEAAVFNLPIYLGEAIEVTTEVTTEE
ncbi:phage holin family protein [Eubacteriales bacterium OttesenSCG-928-N13]|nr:phage holin family protein [Eubacteriales bacterium OttesenSCG-928-N13]